MLLVARIAHESEANVQFHRSWSEPGDAQSSITDAIGLTTCELARELGADGIVDAESEALAAAAEAAPVEAAPAP